MIESLEGIRETVNFLDDFGIRLYNNDEYEDYPNHWHVPIEIIMPLEGPYGVEIDGVDYKLKVHDILLIRSGVLHRLYAPPKGRRIILQVDAPLLHHIKDVNLTLNMMPPVILLTAKNVPDIHGGLAALMREIKDEYFSDNLLKEAAIYAKIVTMLVQVARTYQPEASASSSKTSPQLDKYTEKFLAVCAYIKEHCAEDLTLDEVAELAGFSKYHFSRLFKQFTSESFYKYLNLQRMARAEELLVNPDNSILEVATRSGFSSSSAFLRMFKIHKNCTPSEFRSMLWRRG